MTRSSIRPATALLAALSVFAGAACSGPSPTTCAPDCAVGEPACDDGCPAIANELCVDGACVAVADGSVDVVVDANVHRRVSGTTALLVAVVDARVAGCDDVEAVSLATGVLAGNRFAVTGGSFHEDLAGGLVPAGDIIVVVDAIDHGQAVLAHGCAAAVAAGDSVDVLVAVDP